MLEALKNVSNEQNRNIKLAEVVFNSSATSSQSLSHYANQLLYKQLGNYIANKIPKEADANKILSLIQRIMARYDFRLIGDYLYALETKDNYLISLMESEIDELDFQQKVNHYRFQRLTKDNRAYNRKLILEDNLEPLFSEETPGDIVAYVADPTLKNTFISLFERAQGYLSEYIDIHYDLPGLNSLVRKGLVKSIQLNPDQFIVTKRDNPDKKGRFLIEQYNIIKISDILNLKHQNSFVDLSDESSTHKARLKLIKPFAVFADKQQHKFYSLAYLQEGKTLEEILLCEQDSMARSEYLKNARKILDFLYEKGVIWGDMAPRNTIVNQMSGVTDYYILDFEKTKILNRPATLIERQEHCRGPMCVEEFGAICSMEEVEACFRGYFEPKMWDLNSQDQAPFEKPKRELVAIFEARGEKSYTLGAYNRLEQQVMKVRFPFTDGAKNIKRYPLYICFKVDHYLGNEYDRKTTELLMSAYEYDCLLATVDVLEQVLQNLDNQLILEDLTASACNRSSLQENKQYYEYDFLAKVIDGFYDYKEKPHQFKVAISKYNTELKFYRARLDEVTTKRGIALAKSNCEALRVTLHQIIKSAYANYHPALILLAGGFARGEITYGSDIDTGIISDKNSSEIKKFIENKINEILGFSSEFYLGVALKDVEKHFLDDPESLEDILHGQIVNGDSEAIQSYEQVKNRILRNRNYLTTAVQAFIPKDQGSSKTEIQIKKYLKLCNLSLALASHVGINLDKEVLLSIKDFLLFYKNEYAFKRSRREEINLLDENVMSEIGLYLKDQSSSLLAEISTKEIANIRPETNTSPTYFFTGKIQEKHITSSSLGLVERGSLGDINFEKLMEFFDAKHTNLGVAEGTVEFLTKSIVPSDTFVISSTGATLMTNKGNLIDLSSMTANCILGQNDPWVKACQVGYITSDRPSFHSSRLGSEAYYKYVKRLARLNIGGISNPVINHKQCNGSDAVEIAIKSAYNHCQGRNFLISFKGSYHGQNLTAYLASHTQRQHQFFIGEESSKCIFLEPPTNSCSPFESILSEDEQSILEEVRRIGKDVYAVIIEPVQMNNSVNTCSKQFLLALKQVCSEHDICLIFDEVQTGFGWLGDLSAADAMKVTPNIIALGKAITSGNGPLAITIAESKYGDLKYGTSEKTNGADVRSLVAADAVLDRLLGVPNEHIPEFVTGNLRRELSQGLLSTVAIKSHMLEKYLLDLKGQNEGLIGEVKGYGMIRGIEILDFNGNPDIKAAQKIVDTALTEGVFMRRTNHVLVIKPPLVITKVELDLVFERLNKVLAEYMHSIKNSKQIGGTI